MATDTNPETADPHFTCVHCGATIALTDVDGSFFVNVEFGPDWDPTDHVHEPAAGSCVTTEDGAIMLVGARAFNYYDRKPGKITMLDADGWFDFEHDDGTVKSLNGERICTLAFAQRKGWVA